MSEASVKFGKTARAVLVLATDKYIMMYMYNENSLKGDGI